jgi:hypothetical protein
MNRSRVAAAALAGALALSGCSHSTTSTVRAGGLAAPSLSPPAPADPGKRACTGGLTGAEPGVVRITCDGTATIRVQAGDASREFHGGVCHSAGDIWSAAAGVVIDATGAHGTYAGPSVDSIAVNNTATPGKGTIQVLLGSRHYYDLGEAAMAVTAGGTSAHIEGTSHQLSDAPGAKITVDVTC